MLECVIIQYNVTIIQISRSHDLFDYEYIIFVLLNIKSIFFVLFHIRGKAMANYPQELAQDVVCHSHTGHMTGLWFLPTRPLRLNTNE